MNVHRNKGAASIEFAIVGLAFISLLLLAMETGWQLLINSALGSGARAASRFGSTGSMVAPGITPAPTDRDSSIEDIVIHNSGGLLLPSRLQIIEAQLRELCRPRRRWRQRTWGWYREPGRAVHIHLHPALSDADSGGDHRPAPARPFRESDRPQ